MRKNKSKPGAWEAETEIKQEQKKREMKNISFATGTQENFINFF